MKEQDEKIQKISMGKKIMRDDQETERMKTNPDYSRQPRNGRDFTKPSISASSLVQD